MRCNKIESRAAEQEARAAEQEERMDRVERALAALLGRIGGHGRVPDDRVPDDEVSDEESL